MEEMNAANHYHRISRKALKLFFRQGLVASTFFLVPALLAAAFFDLYWPLIPSGLLSAFAIMIRPGLEYRQWRYRMTPEALDIVHGILFTTHTHIPICRIQHLDIIQGPLQKSLGLTALVIVTAGMTHKIEGIEWERAQMLLKEIGQMVQSGVG